MHVKANPYLRFAIPFGSPKVAKSPKLCESAYTTIFSYGCHPQRGELSNYPICFGSVIGR
ncbi:hypothetical protein DXZ20_06085 [Leptolyngbyaceae cyanobacterium CCMR0081]|uniref:Uncharacterized protein n=1 Tax=Adonisia turfae CCMR0081 TaxID=2292702 RepID=A0A6M0RHN9_9CYAN|nr:hypothetical protein [Adonisia turfae CCMR0081]